MEKTHICKGCGATLKADYRNVQRQHFCARKACQKLRRTLRQRLQRERLRSIQGPSLKASGKPAKGRRPQEASLVSETDITIEDPLIIGLISMITGSTNLEDIQATYRQLWIRGVQILNGRVPLTGHNSDIINLFQAMEQNASRND